MRGARKSLPERCKGRRYQPNLAAGNSDELQRHAAKGREPSAKSAASARVASAGGTAPTRRIASGLQTRHCAPVRVAAGALRVGSAATLLNGAGRNRATPDSRTHRVGQQRNTTRTQGTAAQFRKRTRSPSSPRGR